MTGRRLEAAVTDDEKDSSLALAHRQPALTAKVERAS
jgi:hypothetical protein